MARTSSIIVQILVEIERRTHLEAWEDEVWCFSLFCKERSDA